MCGRFTQRYTWEEVQASLSLTGPAPNLRPRYNLAPIHDRMPVILPTDAFEPWLSGEAVPLGPYPADAMTAHPVGTLVDKPDNDDPRCVEPVAAA